MTILAFYNIKGGVGKTTSCVNLAYLSAAGGQMTLLCDLDPQGAASFYFRIWPSDNYNSKKLLKGAAKIDKHIKGTDFERLDLLPSDLTYRDLDIMIGSGDGGKKSFEKLLRPFESEYEHIFLDCPPNITRFSESIFSAADYIFVPLIPTTLSIRSYKTLTAFFEQYHYSAEKLRPFFSMVEKRKQLHRMVMDELWLKETVIRSFVPYLADIEKMGLYRNPTPFQYPSSLAAQAYLNLWQEMKQIINNK